MALAAHVYPQFQQVLATKGANVSTDALKVLLLTSYTYAATHKFVSDVLGAGTEVAAGGGYTTGGTALSSVSVSTSGSTTTVTCANPTWSASTITAAYAVFYDSTPGSNATNPAMCYWDFGGSFSSTNGTFQLQVSGSGLITLTAS